jgi:hypothetical protein
VIEDGCGSTPSFSAMRVAPQNPAGLTMSEAVKMLQDLRPPEPGDRAEAEAAVAAGTLKPLSRAELEARQ